MSAAAANCSCDQAKRDRAALICLIDTFSIDLVFISVRYFSIENRKFSLVGEPLMAQAHGK